MASARGRSYRIFRLISCIPIVASIFPADVQWIWTAIVLYIMNQMTSPNHMYTYFPLHIPHCFNIVDSGISIHRILSIHSMYGIFSNHVHIVYNTKLHADSEDFSCSTYIPYFAHQVTLYNWTHHEMCPLRIISRAPSAMKLRYLHFLR